MSSNALETQGVFFKFDGTDVGEITSFNGPGGSASIIDVSHLGSTRREKRMGLPDEGQISFDLNLVPNDAGQGKLRDARAARDLKGGELYLTDDSGTILSFDCYCTQFSIQGSVDDKIQGSVTLEVTGVVNWSPRLTIETDWAANVIKLEVAEDTFAAGAETTTNWTIVDDSAGLTLSSASLTSGVVTLTFTGTPAAGTYDVTIQAKAAALTGSFASGILKAPVTYV